MKHLLDFDLHIFDLDDTLVNTRHSYAGAQEAAVRKEFPHLEKNALSFLLAELRWMCRIIGSGNVRQYFQTFLTGNPELSTNIDATVNSLVETYQSSFWSSFDCFEGVFPMLQRLSTLKKNLALVSNGKVESQRRKMDKTGLRSHFPAESCFVSGQFPANRKKPSPFMVDLACRNARVQPERSVYYGNTVEDMLAGNLAGVYTVLYGDASALPSDTPSIARPNMTLANWQKYSRRLD